MSGRCRHCGAAAAEDGFCSKPCAKGASERKVAEDKAAVEAEKKGEEDAC